MTECQSSKVEISSKSTCSHFVENRSRAFRLRPVNTTERIGKKYRYLKSSFLKFVTWTEFALAAGFTLIQVAFLTSCYDEDSFTQASLMGLGLGCIYLFTASVTLVALKEPVYFWLHVAMAMNIVAVVGALSSELLLCIYIEESSLKPFKTKDVVRQKFHGCINTVEDLSALCKWCNGISGILALILSVACGRPVFLGHRDITFRASRHARD